MSDQPLSESKAGAAATRKLSRVTVRIAGDSGDGVQLMGGELATTAAALGNDVATLPDYPAEIRAPAGSLPGVSAFQLSFADQEIYTPGDRPDALVAMNPAALKVNLDELPRGALVIVNKDEFSKVNLKKAGYESSPLEDEALLSNYRFCPVPITSLNQRALENSELTAKEINRCRNFFALGLLYWLYERPLDQSVAAIERKFASKEKLAKANIATMRAGHAFGETTELLSERQRVPAATLAPGTYRNITGSSAMALGLVAAAARADHQLFYGSYPITPASDMLHELARHKALGVKTFQAEDEIAAMGAAVGAAFGGAIATTGTSGPGLALKGEALGLAVMIELPVVVINVQRSGPSTGMPTKTEQSDLLQTLYGRNGDCPLVVMAPKSAADCFQTAFEAVQLATKYMTPVVILSDSYLANASEPWRIPPVDDLPMIAINHPTSEGLDKDADFLPYGRDDETRSRPWAIPGTKGLEHRVGSLEKQAGTGNVSYDPENHHSMTQQRAAKVRGVARDIAPAEAYGSASGLGVISWGSTFGAVRSAVKDHVDQGHLVAHVHLRHLSPFPLNLGQLLGNYQRLLLPELNNGQLKLVLQAELKRDITGYNRITGQPFSTQEINAAIANCLANRCDLSTGDVRADKTSHYLESKGGVKRQNGAVEQGGAA
jgi:2-oxoglutarate ferredoxin oxidoreductase subunit alpha